MSEHLPPLFVIETRQKEDFLFLSVATLLGAGGTLPTGIFQSDGYSVINILGISDQPFRIRIEEAPTKDGPFVQTGLLTSTLDVATGLQKIANRFVPTGAFMRAFIDNLGGQQTVFQVVFAGLPLAGAGVGVSPGGGVTEIIGSPGILANGTVGVSQTGSVTLTLVETPVDVFQARLFTGLNGVSSTLTLFPYKGNEILVNDEIVTVPDLGMTRLVTDNLIDGSGAEINIISPQADTLYYVYVSNSQAAFSPLSIRLSANPPVTVEGVKYLGAAGNARNWRFVGWTYLNATPQFESNVQNRFIVNYYNRIALDLFLCPGYVDNNAVNSYSTGSDTWVQPSSLVGGGPSTLRFISNGEDAVSYKAAYVGNGAAGGGIPVMGVGIDSVTQADISTLLVPAAASTSSAGTVVKDILLSEGLHTLDMLVESLVADPATFYADQGRVGGDAADVPATIITAMIWG